MERQKYKRIVATTVIHRLGGQIGILPLFDMLRLVFSAFPQRTPQGGIEKNLCAFAVRFRVGVAAKFADNCRPKQ
jgi:hypothetical protein